MRMQNVAATGRRPHGSGHGWVGLFGALAAMLALAACQTVPPPAPPTVVNLVVAAGPAINPNAQGVPSPVLVRVYELTSPSAFERSDFFQLLERDGETLGTALAGREEFTLTPGGTQTLTLDFGPESRFIGVLVAFRDIDNAQWRVISPVSRNATSAVSVVIRGLTVQVGPDGAGLTT